MYYRHRTRSYNPELVSFEDLFGVVFPLACLAFATVRVRGHVLSSIAFFSVLILRSIPSAYPLHILGMFLFVWFGYIKDEDLPFARSSLDRLPKASSTRHPLEALLAKRDHARSCQVLATKLLSGYAYFSFYYRFAVPSTRLLYPRAIRLSEYIVQGIPWVMGVIALSWYAVIAWKASSSARRLELASVGQEDGYLKMREDDSSSEYLLRLLLSSSLTAIMLFC